MNQPTFAEHATFESFTTGLVNTTDRPLAHDMLQITMTNVPISDKAGNYVTVPENELVWLLTGIDIVNPDLPSELLRKDVQALQAAFGPQGAPLVEYKCFLRVSYGRHDILKPDDLGDVLVEHLGRDIVKLCEEQKMDIIYYGADSLSTGPHVYLTDEKGNRLLLDPNKNELEAFEKDYPGFKTQEEKFRVKRPYTIDVNLHDVAVAVYDDRVMDTYGQRHKFGPNASRFAGLVKVKSRIGKKVDDIQAVAFGIMPDDRCGPTRSIQPGRGKGRLVLLHPEAFRRVRETAIRYYLSLHQEWLKFHPSPEFANPNPKRAQTPQATQPVLAQLPAPKKGKGKKGKTRRAEEAPAAQAAGNTGPSVPPPTESVPPLTEADPAIMAGEASAGQVQAPASA